MVQDPHVAKRIGDLMQRIAHELEESLLSVQKSCPPGEFERYRNCVGGILGAMYDIVYGIYSAHPELRPPGLFDPDETDPSLS